MLFQFPFKRAVFMGFFLAAFVYASHSVKAQMPHNGEVRSYVVIGAFSVFNNAVKFTEYASNKPLDAHYAMNVNRKLYYVYMFASKDVKEAVAELHKTKAAYPEFYDIWVYTGVLGMLNKDGSLKKDGMNESGKEEMASVGEKDELEEATPVTETQSDKTEVSAVEAITTKKGIAYIYFNTLNAQRHREVKGKVNIIDVERAKPMGQEMSHEWVALMSPNNGTNRVKFVSSIFGFRPIEHIIDLDEPVNDSTAVFTHVTGDSMLLDFEMQRYHKGDVLVMYNVYFYIDAAVMKPESVHELNSLLDMLQENDKLNVKIHGHTNGNAPGKVIPFDPEAKNFFTLKADQEEGYGSAKKLSLARAYTIQQWLIDNGIDENRMDIKGWGGKKMIYDKLDSQADKNVRVEIEIVEE